MRKFNYYRHKNCIDIDIYVVKSYLVHGNSGKYFKLKVYYVKQSNHDFVYNYGSPDNIKIREEKLKNWTRIEYIPPKDKEKL